MEKEEEVDKRRDGKQYQSAQLGQLRTEQNGKEL